MLEAFDRQLGIIVRALAWFACALIPCMFTMIVIDVSIRSLGFRPPLFTSSVVEYALLYLCLLYTSPSPRDRG